MPIDITDQARRVQYVGAGSGPYEFNFEVLQQTDIEVYKDTTLLTLTTDYTVALNADGTGAVTTVASMTGFTVTIAGSRPYARITDFSTGGDFFADTVNDELDSQQVQILQLRDSLDRGIRAPVTDNPSLDMTLPVAASRAGKFMAFDANGELTTSAGTGTDNSLRTDLAASSGSTLVGFLQSGTGAVARTVQAKERDIVCDFDFMTAAQIADVQAGTEIQDVTSAVQAALTAVPSPGGRLYSPAGKRKITAQLNVKAFTHWYGDRATVTTAGTILHCTNQNIDMIAIPNGDWTIRDMVLQHAGTAGTGSILVLGTAVSAFSSGGLLEDCRLYSAPQAAIDMRHAGDTIIRGCGFESNVIGMRATNASGTTADDIRIEGCVFYRNAQDIVASYGLRWLVSGNIFQQQDGPTYASASAGSSWSGTTGNISVLNNLYDTCGGVIRFSGAGLNQFVGNKIFSGKRDGLGLSGTINYNLIADNIFYNGSQATANTYDAIILDSTADHNSILNNIVLAGYRYGVNVSAAGVTNTVIIGNGLHSLATNAINNIGTGTIIRNNQGYATEASGTGSIASGATTAVITHGLNVTPAVQNISITFAEQGSNDYGRWWISTITSTQFTLNVSADPGASNLDFGWQALVL